MENTVIITDTTSDLNKDIIEKYNIKVLPLQIIYKDRSYRDQVDISPREIYDNLDKEIPGTSLPLASDVIELFDSLKSQGVKNVLGIFISAGLSGTYNQICNIAKNYEEFMNIHIVESKSVSWGIGLAVVEAAKAVSSNLSFDKVIEVAKKALDNTRTFFYVSTLSYLKKGGRIGRVEGTIGELLNIRPIVGVDEVETGQYYTLKKVRGLKKAISSLEQIIEKLMSGKSNCHIVIGNCELENMADSLLSYVKDRKEVDSIILSNVTPVIGVHCGPGTIGFAIHCDDGLEDMRNLAV